jgi:hypothetical protein
MVERRGVDGGDGCILPAGSPSLARSTKVRWKPPQIELLLISFSLVSWQLPSEHCFERHSLVITEGVSFLSAVPLPMALNSLTDKLSGTIDYVVARRQQSWNYIKRAHMGEVHWLNVLHLSKALIMKSMPPEKLTKRTRRWFMLGLSFGRLLELSEGATLVRALSQLVEEYEHFIGAKLDVSKSDATQTEVDQQAQPFLYTGSAYGSASAHAVVAVAAQQAQQAAASSQQETIKPTLRKVGRGIMYEYLQTQATVMPEHLDYCEIVHSLCDVLSLIYSKFLDASCQPASVHEAILRLDRKLKQLILTKITADLSNEVAGPAMKREISNLLNRMFIDEKGSNPGPTKKFIELHANSANDHDSDEEK